MLSDFIYSTFYYPLYYYENETIRPLLIYLIARHLSYEDTKTTLIDLIEEGNIDLLIKTINGDNVYIKNRDRQIFSFARYLLGYSSSFILNGSKIIENVRLRLPASYRLYQIYSSINFAKIRGYPRDAGFWRLTYALLGVNEGNVDETRKMIEAPIGDIFFCDTVWDLKKIENSLESLETISDKLKVLEVKIPDPIPEVVVLPMKV